MRGVILAAGLALASLGCQNNALCNDVSGPVATCESIACAICTVESHCQAGIDVNTCATLRSSDMKCTTFSCDGSTFNPTGAEACLQGYYAQSCADNNSGVLPAVCSTVPICGG